MLGGGLTRERAAREPDRLVCSAHWNQASGPRRLVDTPAKRPRNLLSR